MIPVQVSQALPRAGFCLGPGSCRSESWRERRRGEKEKMSHWRRESDGDGERGWSTQRAWAC